MTPHLLDEQVRWGPRPYPQLLRGPRHRWWRPLVGAAVVVVGVVVLLTTPLQAAGRSTSSAGG